MTQLAAYGAVVSAVATFVHTPAPAGERWKSALATPDSPSAELEVTLSVPLTIAEDAGDAIKPVGAVLSTRTAAIAADVSTLPTLSVVIMRRS